MRQRLTPPRLAAALAGLVVLVAAEIVLRRNLEHADKFLYSFLEYFYAKDLPAIFGRPWWRFLLPIPELTGAWSTSLIITHLVELRIGIANTWYLFNALLVVVSFASAWLVFESLAFSFTFAICMGFGTHFFHTYAVTGGMASPLIACVFEIALACAYRFVVARRGAVGWGVAFGISLLACGVSYEGWLDLAVFGCAAAFLFAAIAWRNQAWNARRLSAVGGAVVALVVVYVVVKIRLGYRQVGGGESDVIFNYRQVSPFVEDLVSNVVTHLYMSVTNFLPPMLTSSTALYDIGAENLVAMQFGYHAAYGYLVPMHYLFLWRYAAGALALWLAWMLVRSVRQAWQRPTEGRVVVITGLLMMWLAGSTHALIKIRPMKVAPVMSYHVLVGVIGAALLISYGVYVVWRDWRSTGLRVATTAGVWGVLFYGALARPLMLSHLAAQAGLGAGLYPDPMASLLQMFGVTREYHPGVRKYQLVKRPDSMPEIPVAAPLMSDLPALPIAAPDLAKWSKGRDVKVTALPPGYAVEGNLLGGYQLISPAIAVPPRHRLIVRTQGTLERGNVCLGILDKAGAWLLAPDSGRAELNVETGDNDRVTFVFDICGPDRILYTPRFHVTSVTYAFLMNPDDARR